MRWQVLLGLTYITKRIKPLHMHEYWFDLQKILFRMKKLINSQTLHPYNTSTSIVHQQFTDIASVQYIHSQTLHPSNSSTTNKYIYTFACSLFDQHYEFNEICRSCHWLQSVLWVVQEDVCDFKQWGTYHEDLLWMYGEVGIRHARIWWEISGFNSALNSALWNWGILFYFSRCYCCCCCDIVLIYGSLFILEWAWIRPQPPHDYASCRIRGYGGLPWRRWQFK